MSDQGVRPSLPRSGQLSQFKSARLGVTTYDLQLWKVITPSSMESPLSQESINIWLIEIGTHIKLRKSILTKTTSTHK